MLNKLVFILPFFTAGILTFLTLGIPWLSWLNYLIWLSSTVGAFIFINFIVLSIYSKRREELTLTSEPISFRVASFVTSFNEDPEIVKGTLDSVLNATKGYGDVFLLDDSTNERISTELKGYCDKVGIKYIHRNDRKGFKAGAINNALKMIHGYDLVSIFDADQRPVKSFFHDILQYFKDPKVAMVQVPQSYTELGSPISLGSNYQQVPFLRMIMKGRNRRSTFSLGSGSTFRISALEDVGLMDEDSITEDAATSLKLYDKGYSAIYVDLPLIWYGEPPRDASAFVSQQSRWSLGYFQLTKKMLTYKLNFSTFFDFIAGFFYWLKEGPLTVVEFIAPTLFLLTGLPFLIINPLVYAMAYGSYILVSMALFFYSIKGKEYGLKGFLYHQFVEYLEFFGVTTSFIAWVMRRKVPFKVTPKGRSSRSLRVIAPHIVVAIFLIASIIHGIYLSLVSQLILKYSIYVNLFWASYQLFFILGAVFFALRVGRDSKEYYIKEAN